MALLALTLLLILIVVCRRCLLPRCPSFIKDLFTQLERKLMFNSLLRAMLESYFLVAIQTFKEARQQ